MADRRIIENLYMKQSVVIALKRPERANQDRTTGSIRDVLRISRTAKRSNADAIEIIGLKRELLNTIGRRKTDTWAVQ